MNSYYVTESALIKAPAELVYNIIADYHNGHPYILPKPYFLNLEVEQGGVGEGTIIRFQMQVLGKTETFRATVTEPEPGRVLVESNQPQGSVTTFTVDPVEGGQSAQVTFATELPDRGGLPGLLERFLTRLMLPRIYRKELAQLEAVAQERARAPQS
ncbi:MAG: SRPBCC family protein [Anaerolineae bacterium]|nr:SRPBCC family protein [Anaerolineae bacterium]